VLLLLLVFAARTWNLMQVPPGLTHDEASNGHDSAAILDGVHRIYFPAGYGHEPLYNYSAAFTTLFLGQGIFTLRITTVFWGLVQCALAVALARRWWGRQTALAVLTAYGLSFWALMLARVGLRAPVLPALFTAGVLAYDHAITAAPARAWRSYILAGLCVGASFYTYMASRGMPLVFPLFLLTFALTTRRSHGDASQKTGSLRALGSGTLILLGVALATGAPLFLHLRANPHLEQRIGQLGHAVTALRAGDVRPLWGNIVDSLPMLVWRGDPYWLYNIAGRPGLEPLLAAAFGIGFIHALTRFRDRRNLFLLIWLAGGVAPALIAPVAYNLLRAVAALPAALLLAGRGLSELLSAAASLGIVRRHRAGRYALAALAGGLLIATGWETTHAYFGAWANHRDVRVAYHHHLVALGRHLTAQGDRGPVVITSLYPGEFHDPYTMEVTLGRKDPTLRWADGRQALFVPAEAASLFIEPHSRPAEGLWSFIHPDLVRGSDLTFRDDDLVPELHAYRWDAPATWTRVTTALTSNVEIQPEHAAAQGQVLAPVRFGEILVLEGYVINPGTSGSEQPAPGGSLSLMTAWRVTARTEEEWVIFAHLLNNQGDLISQDDRLGAPSWQWQPGDRFLQLHHVALPDSWESGSTTVALGLYARNDLRRMEIDLGSAPPATRILIPLKGLTP
jgi:hypothetical protein